MKKALARYLVRFGIRICNIGWRLFTPTASDAEVRMMLNVYLRPLGVALNDPRPVAPAVASMHPGVVLSDDELRN